MFVPPCVARNYTDMKPPLVDLIKVGQRLYREGYVISKGGNISIRRGNYIYIKRRGAPLSTSRPADYIAVELRTGKCRSGAIPSTEKSLHILAYRTRPDINTVLHLHPVFSTAVANSKLKVGFVSYELISVLHSPLVKARYRPAGSISLAEEVARLLRRSNAVLMPNHGIVVVADSIMSGYERVRAVERACQILIFTRLTRLYKFLPVREARRIIMSMKSNLKP